jgi:hypothetical protein
MSAFRDGMAGVLGLHGYVQQGFRDGEERKQRNTLAQLTGDYYAAPSQNGLAAIARAGGDPSQSANYGMKMEDREQAEIGQMAAVLANADPARRPEIYAQMQGRIQPFAQKRGLPLPSVWNESILPEVQKIAQVWGAGSSGIPAQVQAFNAFTQGLSPEDQAKARRIELGLDPRASSGLPFGFTEVMDADGRIRLVATDKRTGAGVDVQPGGAPAPTQGGALVDGVEIAGQYGFEITDGFRSPADNAGTKGSAANSGHMTGDALDLSVRGKTPQQIAEITRAYLAAGYTGGYTTRGTAPHLHFQRKDGARQPVASGQYVSPTPGELKRDETLGSEGAKFDIDRVRAEFDQRQAAAVAQSTAEGKAEGERGAASEKRSQDAKRFNTVAQEAMDIFNTSKPTGSGAGAMADAGAAFFGKSTEGAQANARLATIGGQLIMFIPRMEGPQSDKDAAIYRQAAADVANASLPVATRKAALETAMGIQAIYANSAPAAPASSSGGWGIKLKGQ